MKILRFGAMKEEILLEEEEDPSIMIRMLFEYPSREIKGKYLPLLAQARILSEFDKVINASEGRKV